MIATSKMPVEHMPAKPGVYKITNLTTGEIYVGGTANMKSRACSHRCAIHNRDIRFPLGRSAEQSGGSFQIEVLEKCVVAKLDEREQFWIDALKPSLNILKRAPKRYRVFNDRTEKVTVSISRKMKSRLCRLAEGSEVFPNTSKYARRLLERAIKQEEALRKPAVCSGRVA